jgi:hypothetical protein
LAGENKDNEIVSIPGRGREPRNFLLKSSKIIHARVVEIVDLDFFKK